MMNLNPRHLGEVCQPVTDSDWLDLDIPKIEREMLSTCYLVDKKVAVGIAANQVGMDKRMIVVDYGGFRGIMVNPEIIKRRGGVAVNAEGCLSFPKKLAQVRRDKIVSVRYQDKENNTKTFKARGLLARIIQHEVDHLDGITMFDREKEL